MTGPQLGLFIAWAAASAVGLACVGYWAWIALWRPGRALDYLGGLPADTPWHVKPTAWIAILTMAVVYYRGFGGLLAWMPDAWGWVSEGEDGRWGYQTLRGFVTAALTVGALAMTIAVIEPLAQARLKNSK